MIHVSADSLRQQLRAEVSRRENVEAMLEAMRADNLRLRRQLKCATHFVLRVPRPSHVLPSRAAARAALAHAWALAARQARRLWEHVWPEMPVAADD